MQRVAQIAVGGAAVLIAITVVATAATTTRPPFGCFKVTADELNIRDRPHSTAAVIGTAAKGDLIIKRKRFCTLRGHWCAVKVRDLEGYADKSFMTVAPCPPNMSKPAS